MGSYHGTYPPEGIFELCGTVFLNLEWMFLKRHITSRQHARLAGLGKRALADMLIEDHNLFLDKGPQTSKSILILVARRGK